MTSKNENIERFLDYLINPNECIDTYGRSYIDDLDFIVVENHHFNAATQTFPDAEAQTWFERLKQEFGFKTLADLIAYVRANQDSLDLANVRPRSTFHTETTYADDPTFKALSEEDSVERSNEFQKEWSKFSATHIPNLDDDADIYELYMSYDRMNPWTYAIGKEVRRGNLTSKDKVLCIGNRWLGEIYYFRENLGLKSAIGVDLFTANPGLVVAADMHKMPFEDNSVKMIFNRGLLNKSYDVRLLAKEMLRVLKPDGFIIIETPGPYAWGVSRLTRTDVKSVDNMLKLFEGRVKRIIYSDERKPIHYKSDSTRLVRLFIQLDKKGVKGEPIVEPFSQSTFDGFDKRRRLFVRVRGKLRRMGLLPKPKR